MVCGKMFAPITRRQLCCCKWCGGIKKRQDDNWKKGGL